jgi:hypothetical protein
MLVRLLLLWSARGRPRSVALSGSVGYHRWDGGRYLWVPGRWERPPREHAIWVQHHWVHRHGGWVLEEGHWR